MLAVPHERERVLAGQNWDVDDVETQVLARLRLEDWLRWTLDVKAEREAAVGAVDVESALLADAAASQAGPGSDDRGWID